MGLEKAEEFKKKGNAAFKAGDFAASIAFYNTAIQIDPSDYTYPLNRSLAYLKQQKYIQAQKDATTALELDPENAGIKAYYRRGLAYKGLKKWAEAKKDFLSSKRAGGGNEVDVELKEFESLVQEEQADAKVSSTTKEADQKDFEGSRKPTTTTQEPKPPANPDQARFKRALDGYSAQSHNQPLEAQISKPSKDLLTPVSTRKIQNSTPATTPKSAPAPSDKTIETKPLETNGTLTETSKDSFSLLKQNRNKKKQPIWTSSSCQSLKTKDQHTLNTESKIFVSDQANEVVNKETPVIQSNVPMSVRPTIKKPTHIPLILNGASFEHSFTNSPPEAQLTLLRSLEPSSLAQIFQASLSPSLLGDILTLLAVHVQQPPIPTSSLNVERWIIDLLYAFPTVPRFRMIRALLGDHERQSLNYILEQGKKDIDQLGKQWGV